jgi:hypothetical protein
MNKSVVDNNVLRYMVADSEVERELRKHDSKIYLTVIVLEELISRIEKTSFDKYISMLRMAKYFGPILPEPSLYCAVQWGVKPGLEIASEMKKNSEDVEAILMAKDFDEISEFVNSVKVLCHSKRSLHNKAFSKVAKTALERWRSEKRNLKNRPAFIKSSYEYLIQEKYQRLFLESIRQTAFSSGMNLSSQYGYDENGLKELMRREKSIVLPTMASEEYETQSKFFEGYIKIYASYVARRALKESETNYFNDSNDLALSRYLSFGYSIVTGDEMLRDICSDAGFSTRFLLRTQGRVPLYLIESKKTLVS